MSKDIPVQATKQPLARKMDEAEIIRRQKIAELAKSMTPMAGDAKDDVSVIRQNADPLRAELANIDALLPVEGQAKTMSLFELLTIKSRFEEVGKALTSLIERHKYNLGKFCIERDEPMSGIADPNLTISVKPAIRFNADPQCWDKVPREFFQKRLLEGQVADLYANNDAGVLELVEKGILKQTPYLKVDVRRKPGRSAHFIAENGMSRGNMDGDETPAE